MFDVSFANFLRSEGVQHQVWVGVGGAMLVLLQSILSGTRRVWWRLAASCFIGGAASALAGHLFADSKWVYVICGVVAIVAENIIFGLMNASEEFKQNPIKVFGTLWRIVMPSFGRGIDTAANIENQPGKDSPPAVG